MEAERSNRAKDEFLAMLAHELRNPLAAVQSAIDVIRSTGDAKAVIHAADVAERQLAHQVRLLDDLLDVARVTNGTISLRRSEVRLRAVIDDALQAVRESIESRGQQLAVHLTGAGETVLGDHTRLVQVVSNLLANATKYTPEGGRLELLAGVEQGSSSFVCATTASASTRRCCRVCSIPSCSTINRWRVHPAAWALV